MTSKPHRLRRALLIPVLTLYSVFFAELFLRFMKPSPLLPRYVTAAPYGVRMNVPGATYWQTTREVRVQVRINEQGIRWDRAISRHKPEGVCRVVLYGDSFFMGYEVDLEDSFAFLLEDALRAAGHSCEVVNLAVSGFGTAEMLVALQADGLGYDPDLVVFQWHATDPIDNLRSGLFGVRDGQLTRLAEDYLPAVELRDRLSRYGIYRWVIENSHLYASLREATARRVKAVLAGLRASGRADPTHAPAPTTGAPGRSLDALLLRAAQQETRSRGAAFLVVEIPSRNGPGSYRAAPAAFADGRPTDLHWVSPLEAFHAAAGPDRLLYREFGHGHLTELGNRVLTRVVVDYIDRERLLRDVEPVRARVPTTAAELD